MIVLDAGPSRFQLRAAALIRAGDHVLVHSPAGENIWSLPGGRVEFGESAAETLAREIREELSRAAAIGPLRCLIENYFTLDGRDVHELCLIHDAALTEPLRFHETEIVHRCRDGATDLEFRWVHAATPALDAIGLYPAPLRQLIGALPDALLHVVHRDTV
ncbi:NUDIX hydrolase [Zavarzinia compransoris]|uniref:NUDIX hydrolase n=2 Tax=Zavarzinia compransoris TaxID=1264899 RepID=A0A317DWV2_9PROT|nr:NUDIX hydrolase [Zavarzinia compransoris]